MGRKKQGSALRPAGAVRPQTPSVGTSHTRHDDTSWAVQQSLHRMLYQDGAEIIDIGPGRSGDDQII